jgi:hypothetical protein
MPLASPGHYMAIWDKAALRRRFYLINGNPGDVKRSLCEVFHLCDVGELKHGFVANSMARHGGKHTFGLVADLATQA